MSKEEQPTPNRTAEELAKAIMPQGWQHMKLETVSVIQSALDASREEGRREAQQWRKIESAPSGTNVLACIYPVYRAFVCLKNIRGVWVSVYDGDPNQRYEPTHWMPLPAPPSSAAAGTHVKPKGCCGLAGRPQ